MTVFEHLGKVAYHAYCDSRGWKSFSGEELPHWGEVETNIKVGWIQAARAVRITLQGYLVDIQSLDAEAVGNAALPMKPTPSPS
jgi:hypothetical protein